MTILLDNDRGNECLVEFELQHKWIRFSINFL